MFAQFSGRHVGGAKLHTGLCKFAQNISTNIWSLGKRKNPKLRSFFITNILWHYNFLTLSTEWFSNYFSIEGGIFKILYTERIQREVVPNGDFVMTLAVRSFFIFFYGCCFDFFCRNSKPFHLLFRSTISLIASGFSYPGRNMLFLLQRLTWRAVGRAKELTVKGWTSHQVL